MWRLILQAFNLELLEAAEEALQYLSAGTLSCATHQGHWGMKQLLNKQIC